MLPASGRFIQCANGHPSAGFDGAVKRARQPVRGALSSAGAQGRIHRGVDTRAGTVSALEGTRGNAYIRMHSAERGVDRADTDTRTQP